MKHPLQAPILNIIEECFDMTVATVRPDGAPQATVVSYVHDGLLLYFGCDAKSQKAQNIKGEPRVSITITPAYKDWPSIRGLSMAATAAEVTVAGEIETAGRLMLERFPQLNGMEQPEGSGVSLIRLRPTVISVLDYIKGFGHTDLLSVEASDIAETLDTMRHHWIVPAA